MQLKKSSYEKRNMSVRNKTLQATTTTAAAATTTTTTTTRKHNGREGEEMVQPAYDYTFRAAPRNSSGKDIGLKRSYPHRYNEQSSLQYILG